MKYISIITIAALALFTSCKNDTKTEASSVEPHEELSIAEKIANAHGFENWDKVSNVKFSFAVDRDTIKGNPRVWEWFPHKDSIILKTTEETFAYNQSKVDSSLIRADRAFINDKFWFMVPFQLVWDSSATISETKLSKAPISGQSMQMISLTYPSEGGYTPGDAYDIYYDENYLIKEWTFRKGNSETPSLSTTFENYQDFNGIKIAIDHKQEGGNWNLNFSDVSITLK